MDTKEVNNRLKSATVEKKEILDLSRLQIHNLPSSLKELHWLIELDISLNNLDDLPLWIKELKNLRRINLSGN